MEFVSRNGIPLIKNGKLVTNKACCCEGCLEDCVDGTIAITINIPATAAEALAVPKLGLPIIAVPQLGDPVLEETCECTGISGPFVLSYYAHPDPVAGCCYWRLLNPGSGEDECKILSIHASWCRVDETITMTVTIDYDDATTRVFSKSFDRCWLCAEVPGVVELVSITGDCETEATVDVAFAGSCCHTPVCTCECFSATPSLWVDWDGPPPVFDPDGCHFGCSPDRGFPAPPWEMVRILGPGASDYRFGGDFPGGSLNMYLRCSRDAASSCSNCQDIGYGACLYEFSIECGYYSPTRFLELHCDQTVPTVRFPIYFGNQSNYTCGYPTEGPCVPWRVKVYTI